MMVAVTAAPVPFTAVKAAISPVPLAGSPIEGVLFVQVKLVAVPVKLTAVVLVPLHSSWLAMAVTVGVGCTVIVNVCVGPLQVNAPKVYFGVTVSVAMTGLVVAFAAVNVGTFPVPLAPRPIEVVLFVQSYDVPVPTKAAGDTVAPLHTVRSTGSFTAGVGFTVIVKDCVVPTQAP